MAPSKVAAVLNGEGMAKATDSRPPVNADEEEFAPSVWGDFFTTYVPPISQRSEEWMRERAELLKEQVRQVFSVSLDAMGIADLVTYVDTLERLGLDNHFPEVIEAAIDRIRAEEAEPDIFNSLHIVSLRFRLLRQHGIWVSKVGGLKKMEAMFGRVARTPLGTDLLREAIWSSQMYQPTFKEHEEVSIMSSGLPMLTIITLMGYGDVATQEVFEWVDAIPEMVRAGSQVTRFLNDLSSYKLGKHKKDMPSAVETYMIENGLNGDEAVAAVTALLENRWRILNQESMNLNRTLLPAVHVVVNMARANEIIYLHGRDAYTFGDDLKDLVTTLFIKQVPL